MIINVPRRKDYWLIPIYRDGEEIFNINKVVRRVLPIKEGSNENIKSVGIPHPISSEEVKNALRMLSIDSLLNE